MAERFEDRRKSKIFSKTKKLEKAKRNLSSRERIYYSGLTLFLLFAILQVGWSVVMNFSKAVSFNSKKVELEHLKDATTARNEQLKAEIQSYSQISQLEGIARNSLKMASEDEVLILINEQQQQTDINTAKQKTKSKKNQQDKNSKTDNDTKDNKKS